MGLLDGLLKQATGGQSNASGLGGLMSVVASNPQIIAALAGLLSTRDASIGGSGGLGGLVNAFQSKGLGDMMSNWISTGPNPPVSAAQLTDVLGQDTLSQFASRAGVPASDAGSLLAGLLPAAIDQLTPDGKVPETSALESTLGSLLAGLGR
jgi:uncharacterized protein YidB (DUF937 family)